MCHCLAQLHASSARTFRVKASRFEYSPAEISVNHGDKIIIEFVFTNISNGLYRFFGRNLHVRMLAEPTKLLSIDFGFIFIVWCCRVSRISFSVNGLINDFGFLAGVILFTCDILLIRRRKNMQICCRKNACNMLAFDTETSSFGVNFSEINPCRLLSIS